MACSSAPGDSGSCSSPSAGTSHRSRLARHSATGVLHDRACRLSHRRTRAEVSGCGAAALVAGIGVILLHTDATTPFGLTLVLSSPQCAGRGNVGRPLLRQGQHARLRGVGKPVLRAAPLLCCRSRSKAGRQSAMGSRIGISPPGPPFFIRRSPTRCSVMLPGGGCSRYPAATVAPISLPLPVFGVGRSALWLDEPLQSWKLAAAALVMAGLCLNVLWAEVRRRPRGAHAACSLT